MANSRIGKNKTARISFLLEDELCEQFNDVCDKKGFNKSKLIRNFIASIIEENVNSIENTQTSREVSFSK